MSKPLQHSTLVEVLHQTQQQHLDDTDIYASVWQDAVRQSRERRCDDVAAPTSSKVISVKWGGRGQGGRGVARRTIQPNDISIPDGIRLEYVGVHRSADAESSNTSAPSLLLEDARLSLLSGHIYGMIGRNGCGKSSLLRRIDSCKIPGFPIHIATLLIQPHPHFDPTFIDDESATLSTIQYLIHRYHSYCLNRVQSANHSNIRQLEDAIERLDLHDGSNEDENEAMLNEYMEAIASYEELIADSESMMKNDKAKLLSDAAAMALQAMGLPNELLDHPFHGLTNGQQSKVLLALILLCCTLSYCDLLLIDEITSSLDVHGLIQLRRIIQMITLSPSDGGIIGYNIPFVQASLSSPNRKPTTVVLVSSVVGFA
jgi:ABC-type transport system involved in cytochrome c biogenesis ATPase subunit